MPRPLRLLPVLVASLALPLLARAAAPVDPAAFAAARALLDARKPAEAQAAFEKLAAAHPSDPEVNFYLGELALRRNEPEKASPYYEKCVAAAPTSSRYHRRLGDSYGSHAAKASVFSKPGLAKKCLAAYEKAVALDPADIDARQSVFEFYRQAPALFGGGVDKATATAEAIKKLDVTRGHNAFATLYAGEKKFAEALAEYDAILRAKPDDYATLYQIGRLAAVSGRFPERGLTALRRCLALPVPSPNSPGHAAANWRIGVILESQRDLPGARAAYEAALKLEPKFTQAAEALKQLPAR
jgi:tetratricopeptide (TPR) repeat protein